ncbi:MAG: Hsp20/alpha crystallin family protein, partial [Myxococcota bacterium]
QNATNGAAGRPERAERPVLAPRVDIYESDTDVLVTADLPGVPEDQVKLNLDKDELILEAATQLGDTPGDAVAQEFANVDYRRVFLLPKGIDVDNITAKLEHGVLRVRLPKSPQVQPRKIEVRAS